MASNPTTRIGVLLLDAVQVLDVSPIDIFGMLSQSYLSTTPFPASLKAGAVPMEILYINQAGPDALHQCTASLGLRVDASITDKICAPPEEGGEKTLDILLIPGPDPWAYKPTDALNGFIKGHFGSGTDVLTICTGVYPAGHAGILNGRNVTGPRPLVPELSKKFPEAAWGNEDKRWVSDGNLWSSEGGVTNGQDMVAAYIRQKWPGATAEAMIAMAEVGERSQYYESP
ncbi:hypothetical protein IMSHALPRED_010957 [Imshaugia aleurites]|uniref:DJ-1/PfpI domain-containing protein n=1 Tax=Imshaugia aleurites TaxID=172621 RepID=A0A8H3G690_9LECA|nr:hypothetical protein IMSHALPRED_010957 [Imshaugia aleurites]